MLVMLSFVVGGCASQQDRLLKKRQEDVLKSYRIQVTPLMDQRFRLKEQMTEKEWNRIFRNR